MTLPKQETPKKTIKSSIFSGILKKVTVVVDVKLGDEALIDCSSAVASKLEQLGATIAKRFTPKVTHLVVSHYSTAWKEKIRKWHEKGSNNLKVVSPLWVNSCFLNKSHVDESAYFPINKGNELSGGSASSDSKGRSAIKATQKNTGSVRHPVTNSASKRRAQSMEPMPADAIMKRLNTNSQQKKRRQSTGVWDTKYVKKTLDMNAEENEEESALSKLRGVATSKVTNSAVPQKEKIEEDVCISESCSEEEDLLEATAPPASTNLRSEKRTKIENKKECENSNDLFYDEKIEAGHGNKKTKKKDIGNLRICMKRFVIAITGADGENYQVIESAIHAIDLSLPDHSTGNSCYRKSRLVKTVDRASAITHLVVSGDSCKRTIKVLFAIARGAWIVSDTWVFASLENGKWLDEAEYEINSFANKKSRLMSQEDRLIFKGTKIFVSSNVDPPKEILRSLIQCGGGEICNQVGLADVGICFDASLYRRAKKTGCKVVTPKWIIDSIASMKLQEYSKYSTTTEKISCREDNSKGDNLNM